MPNTQNTNQSQNLIDMNPVLLGNNGVSGVAAAEAARLMAGLELLNGQFKQDEMALMNTANQAQVNEASEQKAQGTAAAIGAGFSATAGGLMIGNAARDMYITRGVEGKFAKEFSGVDEELKANQMKLQANKNPKAGVVPNGGDASATAAQLSKQTPKEELKMDRESLQSKRKDIERRRKEKLSKNQNFMEARKQALHAVPQTAQMASQSQSEAHAANATLQKSMSSLTGQAAQQINGAREELDKTGTSLTQISFFAAAVAASRA